MNETKIQVKPNLVMHEIYMQGCKCDWTVLSADKAEGKMSIKLLLGSLSHFAATGTTVFVLRISCCCFFF